MPEDLNTQTLPSAEERMRVHSMQALHAVMHHQLCSSSDAVCRLQQQLWQLQLFMQMQKQHAALCN
jgi:hypothetical protein